LAMFLKFFAMINLTTISFVNFHSICFVPY
jgi:hypothetical protein